MAEVVVGVGGGIAAYKVAGLVRRFGGDGHSVTVVPTQAALEFVGAATWSALSGNPVSTTVWDRADEVRHVRIGQQAELVVVAPATADLMARAAAGMADDLLTATLLTASCPVVFVPAMHTEMWEHPATRANVETLRRRGAHVLEPASGRLTGPDAGPGRMPEPEAIFDFCAGLLVAGGDLAGRRVLVSAGGTREALDPVRFLSNRSSGKQGYALAATAARRGADVTVVAANVELPDPPGTRVVTAVSADDMLREMRGLAPGAGVVVMAAAVADFRPSAVSTIKIKKGPGEPGGIDLVRTVDILADLVARREPGQIIVGFAAETGDDGGSVAEYGRRKLAAKGCDLLVVNDVSGDGAFGSDTNEVTILDAGGGAVHVDRAGKDEVSQALWDRVLGLSR